MPTNTQVSSDIDTLLRLSSKVAVQDYLGVDDNTSGVAANTAAIAKRVGNDTTGEAAGSDSVVNMVSLTQAEYDTALANFPATIKATTLYIIKP